MRKEVLIDKLMAFEKAYGEHQWNSEASEISESLSEEDANRFLQSGLELINKVFGIKSSTYQRVTANDSKLDNVYSRLDLIGAAVSNSLLEIDAGYIWPSEEKGSLEVIGNYMEMAEQQFHTKNFQNSINIAASALESYILFLANLNNIETFVDGSAIGIENTIRLLIKENIIDENLGFTLTSTTSFTHDMINGNYKRATEKNADTLISCIYHFRRETKIENA